MSVQGKALRSQAQQLVLNLLDYFQKEKDNDGPLLPLSCVQERVAAALGISISSVQRIKSRSKNNPILSSPGKQRRRRKTKSEGLPDASKMVVRDTLYNMYSKNNDGYLPLPKAFGTISVHAGQNADQWNSMAMVPPIVLSATFVHKDPEKYQKYIYGRSGNPTRHVLEKCLASIEGAEYSLCFSSGLASLTTLLGVLAPGDHIICCDDMYGGNFNVLHKIGKNIGGIDITVVDFNELINIKNAIKSNTKLIFLETPSNPTFKVTDIKAVAELSKQNNLLLAVDNTFMTPYFQRPLDFGADVIIYSLSKYINGHSDIIMGAIVTNNKDLHEKLHGLQLRMGNIPSPVDCALVTRSIRTLAVRMRQHHTSSLTVAKFLEKHPRVKKVVHPGLPSHPQHELFKKQASGHGGMLSLYINGDREDTLKFIGSLKLIEHAGSLGGPQTLIARPITLISESIPTELKKTLNITENFVRISVGLEDVEDIIEDLKQALDTISS